MRFLRKKERYTFLSQLSERMELTIFSSSYSYNKIRGKKYEIL
jgi:hypothetical protein